jgi:phosphomannomutase
MEILNDYLDFMMKFKGDYSGLKVAFDLSNGMSCLFARKVFGDGPAYIFDEIDGRFPNHEPNPLVAKNVEPLKELVAREKADVGVIYDGDADRVMFVDEKSQFVAPDLVIALMSEYFIKERGEKAPRVLQEIRSSKAVGEFLAQFGVELHTWRVGRAFAAPKLREIDGLWGGELAGHYYFKDFFYSDSGLLASMIVLRIVAALKKEGITLSEAIASIWRSSLSARAPTYERCLSHAFSLSSGGRSRLARLCAVFTSPVLSATHLGFPSTRVTRYNSRPRFCIDPTCSFILL